MENRSSYSPGSIVTIVIPCYNHGKFLHVAIESILSQDYTNTEIIVVDDGSSDNTKEVAQGYSSVKYIYQTNQGLSAARNTGIRNSSGDYLIFLDADDWLLPGAIKTNLNFFRDREDVAFVSGAYQMLLVQHGNIAVIKKAISDNHYANLLKVNYIGMHAAVMFRRSVIEQYYYDTTLKASEDYDLYLRIARKYPVIHHEEPIAMYRKHGNNMSGNIPLMMEYTLHVLGRQKEHLKNSLERKCYNEGLHFWKKYYAYEVYTQLRTIQQPTDKKRSLVALLKQYDMMIYLKYIIAELVKPSKLHLKPALHD